jgi:hypothetical protein
MVFFHPRLKVSVKEFCKPFAVCFAGKTSQCSTNPRVGKLPQKRAVTKPLLIVYHRDMFGVTLPSKKTGLSQPMMGTPLHINQYKRMTEGFDHCSNPFSLWTIIKHHKPWCMLIIYTCSGPFWNHTMGYPMLREWDYIHFLGGYTPVNQHNGKSGFVLAKSW